MEKRWIASLKGLAWFYLGAMLLGDGLRIAFTEDMLAGFAISMFGVLMSLFAVSDFEPWVWP